MFTISYSIHSIFFIILHSCKKIIMLRKYLYISLLLLISCGNILSQEYNFKYFGVKDGLSQSQVTDLCIDNLGNLWVGTEYAGITVYNGNDVTYYSSDNVLPDNRINSLYPTEEGHIFIGTDKGYVIFDGTSFLSPDTLTKNTRVFGFACGKEGDVWIATAKGIFKYNTKSGQTTFPFREKRAFYSILYKNGQLLASAFRGLYTYSNDSLKQVEDRNLSYTTINDIFTDHTGTTWIGTINGLFRMSDDASVTVSHPDLQKAYITTIKEGQDSSLWIGTNGLGIFKIKDGNVLHISVKNGLKSKYVNNIHIDNNQNIWVGLDGGGVALFQGFLFRHYRPEINGSGYNVIMSLLVDKNNNKWFGTDAHGLLLFKDNSYKVFKKKDGLGSLFINDIIETQNNNLWIGGHKGITKYSNGIFTNILPDSLKEVDAISLLEDFEGNIWIGTKNHGAIKYDGTEFKSFHHYTNFQSDVVWDIHQASDGKLYFGTSSGFYILVDESTLINYNTLDGLVNNSISTIIEGPYGNIFIGTDNGISVFNGNTFKNYSTNSGLLSNVIYLMKFDQNGILWVGSEKGLDIVETDKNGNIEVIRSFTAEDGFTSIECNHNAIDFDTSGQIWIGTINGVTVLDPDYLFDDTIKPSTHITEVQLSYRKTKWNEFVDSLYGYYSLPYNLELNHKNNNLTFEFAGIYLKNPKKVKYTYKLDGLDEEWLPSTKNTFATYTNIPPGDYKFMVKASANDNSWSEPAIFEFTVKQPYWQTTWFYIGLIILILVLIYLYISLRTKYLHQLNKSLEKKVHERTQELNRQNEELEEAYVKIQEATKFKESFIANTSHEIRTPLNAIIGFNNLLLNLPEGTKLKKQYINYFKNIKHSSENLMVIINDILDFSKIEAGKLTIEKTTFNIAETIQKVVSTINIKALEKNVNLVYNIDKKIMGYYIGDPYRLSQILINLGNNAVKFTEAGGKVEINVKLKEQTENYSNIIFEVIDNGIGIEEGKKEKIFESYHQAEDSTTRQYGGTGLGLTIVKNLVELMDGSISFTSEVNKGTKFWINFSFEKATETYTKKAVYKFDCELKDCHPQPLNILLVEDNKLNRHLAYETIISWNKDIEINTAENGRIALSKLKNNQYSLILMDLQMPVMDGYQAINNIRQKFPHPQNKIPVIAMSAHAMQHEKERCFALGVNEYIVKPFNPEDIYRIIKFYTCKYIASKIRNGETVDMKTFKCIGKSHKETTIATQKEKEIRKARKVYHDNAKEFQYIDLTNLEKMNQGDKKKMKALLNSYLEILPQQMEELQTHLDNENWEELSSAAHTIKPSMFYLGMNTVFENMKIINASAKENPNKKRLEGFITESLMYWKKASKEIENYVGK